MPGATSSTYAALLKKLYTTDDIADAMYPGSPTFGLIKKNTSLTGATYEFPIQIGANQGTAVVFANAQANVGYSNAKCWTITTKDRYATARYSGKLLKQTANKAGAFVAVLTSETDGTLHVLNDDLAFAMFNNGGNARGQISAGSVVGSLTITLANPKDIVNFEVGQTIRTSAADGTSGAQRAGTDVITALNRGTGTITLGHNWNAGGGYLNAVASDYIFKDGDFEATNSGIFGIPAWIPNSDPSATLFNNVDRTADIVRLSGIRISGSGLTMQEVVADALGQADMHGASEIDTCVMHPANMADLVKELLSKQIYQASEVKASSKTAGIGYDALEFFGPTGKIQVYSDRKCPYNRFYLLTLNTWELVSMGPVPHVIEDDDNRVLRMASADDFEMRFRLFADLLCKNPGKNATVSL